MRDNFQINIYGAGLYGILLAFKLSKLKIVRELKIKIKLFEKGENILPGWDYVEVNEHKFNTGFHAIEMPRAEKTFQLLKELLNEDLFTKKNNFKLISIDGFTTKLGSSITEWPNFISSGLKDLLDRQNGEFLEDIETTLKNEIKNYALGDQILYCVDRYSNNLFESWSEFYPWFFPKECINNLDQDEGSKFRFKIIKGLIEPYYIQPKYGLFLDLKNKIEENLKKHNIEIIKKIELKKNQIIMDHKNKNVLNAWASSSPNILKTYSKSKLNNLVIKSKNLIIAVYSIKSDFLNQWRSRYQYCPSEILILTKEIPPLSRISFPNVINNKNSNKSFIYLEFYSDSNVLSDNLIKKTNYYLANIFEKNVNYEGSTFVRKTFYLNHNNLNMLENEVLEIAKRINLNLPYVYWGPINMAKCGIEAEKATIKINEELINIFN